MSYITKEQNKKKIYSGRQRMADGSGRARVSFYPKARTEKRTHMLKNVKTGKQKQLRV